jgi:hypothetical protein
MLSVDRLGYRVSQIRSDQGRSKMRSNRMVYHRMMNPNMAQHHPVLKVIESEITLTLHAGLRTEVSTYVPYTRDDTYATDPKILLSRRKYSIFLEINCQ